MIWTFFRRHEHRARENDGNVYIYTLERKRHKCSAMTTEPFSNQNGARPALVSTYFFLFSFSFLFHFFFENHCILCYMYNAACWKSHFEISARSSYEPSLQTHAHSHTIALVSCGVFQYFIWLVLTFSFSIRTWVTVNRMKKAKRCREREQNSTVWLQYFATISYLYLYDLIDLK